MTTTASAASTAASTTSTDSSSTPNNSLNNITVDQFMKMMITEMQNQDPTSPMKNSEILQEVSQISQLSASNKLTDTLNSVLLGQNISSAGALIGKTIDGLNAAGAAVSGVVDSVTVSGGKAVLNVGSETVDMKNIRDIRS